MNNRDILEEVRIFISEASTSNSIIHKKKVIEDHPNLKELFSVILDNRITFGVKPKSLDKGILTKNVKEYENLFDLLKDLKERELTGHAAISSVNLFINKNIDYKEEIIKIIDKDLKVRVDASLVNAVYPGCVDVFEVALAKSYEDYKDKIDFKKSKIYKSQKLDGVRLITDIDANGRITFMSREGNEFTTLGKLEKEIKNLNLRNVVLDGEICIVNNGIEDFKDIVSQIKRKDHTIENPKYFIFDYIDREKFYAGYSPKKLSERFSELKNNIKENDCICILPQEICDSKESLQKSIDHAREFGQEGVMLRFDLEYESGRSKNLLKVKDFISGKDSEYFVVGTVNSKMMVPTSRGQEEKEILKSVEIEHKGNKVNVGSGFSISERIKYFNSPEEIIGKKITVQYFEESFDENGKPSLRFPVFKGIRNYE